MVHVHHNGVVDAPLAYVFDYVADYQNLAEWMFGIQKVKLVSGDANEAGSRYDVAIKIGATIKSTLEVTEKNVNSLFATESRAGFSNQSSWRFREISEGSTEITIDVEYQLPGGLAGRVMGKAIEPFVSVAVSHSDDKLRSILQRRYQESIA
ncbi:SRPBCC family protein [Mycobacterium sp. CBMA271]|uniref:SRPBCC family protein n=1 Tax=unclassified Mycobacteroides TaxID=2618759 RepID=UPI0012DCF69D|nr:MULTISPECIES: SRPBCC family protein [unclassified Mycobacteroides]MUM19750.1 hypothetical protein [Mycobacteroides sp. CBMA 326]MUM21094.1 SRPBCC family protein [Mycobacteroides sp. CBMA 271]